jgi:ABC-type amino acid transport substrate-binding protein
MAELDKASGFREALKVWGGSAAVVVLGLILAYQFVEPAPPDSLVLATGDERGTYHALGLRYREAFADYGIAVELKTTAGSVENVELLRNGEADVAFVQGGVVPPHTEQLEGIASLYFEPLWFFHSNNGANGSEPIERLSDLAGKRIQVGAEGSGTRTVAMSLLQINDVDDSNATLIGDSDSEAADRLLNGQTDGAFFVAAPGSEIVRRLMADEGDSIRLFDSVRILAYERVFPYLARVELPEGSLDFAKNVPDRQISLPSPTATMLATEELHPAIVPLFIESAHRIHGGGDLLAPPGTFPSPRYLDVPLSEAAASYYESGRSFLYRVLPFSVAASLDRLKILLLPLITLLFPLFKIAGPLYTWSIRSKIYRWYGVMRDVEKRFDASDDAVDVSTCLKELSDVEREIDRVEVPVSYMEELYNLRMHLARIQARIAPGDGTSS